MKNVPAGRCEGRMSRTPPARWPRSGFSVRTILLRPSTAQHTGIRCAAMASNRKRLGSSTPLPRGEERRRRPPSSARSTPGQGTCELDCLRRSAHPPSNIDTAMTCAPGPARRDGNRQARATAIRKMNEPGRHEGRRQQRQDTRAQHRRDAGAGGAAASSSSLYASAARRCRRSACRKGM